LLYLAAIKENHHLLHVDCLIAEPTLRGVEVAVEVAKVELNLLIVLTDVEHSLVNGRVGQGVVT